MNRKISTLLAGVALFGAMSANVQAVNFAPTADLSLALDRAVTKLVVGENAGLYQIAVNLRGVDRKDYVLSMDMDGKLTVVEAGVAPDYKFENTLWCVNVVPQAQGQNPKYDFTNKATGRTLDISMAAFAGLTEGSVSSAEIIAGGDVSGWALSREYKSLNPGRMYSYFSEDSIVGFSVEATTKELSIVKYGANKLDAQANSPELTYFELISAAPVRLSATDINTMMGLQTADKGVKLTFTPDELGVSTMASYVRNPFSNAKFFAEAVAGNADYVYIKSNAKSADADGTKWLRVDTAYTNQSGARFLAFAWEPKVENRNKMMLSEQYKFAFTYYPSIDSVVVQVKEARKVSENAVYKYWNEIIGLDGLAKPGKENDLSIRYALLESVDGTATQDYEVNRETASGSVLLDAAGMEIVDAAKDGAKCYNNYITVQDLLRNEVRIITVADRKESNIKLGYTGCVANNVRTSLADGVYFIKNAQGQYLASPIYENGPAKWVTVNEKEQNVEHMPAYQWVVLKQNTTDKTNISPVLVSNREYPAVSGGYNYKFTLNKNAGATYMYLSNTSDVVDAAYASKSEQYVSVLTSDSLLIQPVSEAAVSNKNLGYKYFAPEELMINKYTFNYWHPYSTEKFIAKSSKDSTLTVLEGKSQFVIDTLGTYMENGVNEKFGYVVTDAVKRRLPKLAQLQRTVYVVSEATSAWKINLESKFNVGKTDAKQTAAYKDQVRVFFKENNYINSNSYYAIVEGIQKVANTNDFRIYANDQYVDGTTPNAWDNVGNRFSIKAGVSDYDGAATLKSQVLDETRTSAFLIAPDKTPLYRRFNNAALGESASDGRDSLVFKETIRGEYLMDEHNPALQNKPVNYLGIWNKEKAENKLAFRIDTAWLNRGAGEVKPQYLLSVSHDDQAAIETIPCTEDEHHFTADGQPTDKWNCVHAKKGKAGFVYGKYLVSFADSARNNGAKKPYMDIDGGYTRVGFVKAIHVGDSLIILANGFDQKKASELDLSTVIKAYKDANVDSKYIVNLTTDRHKNVTWSFRYVDPSKAANVTKEGAENSFLIESNVYTKDDVSKNYNIPGNNSAYGWIENAIAPQYAAWLKMQNGCIVLTRGDSKFGNAKTGSDGALIFNAYQRTDEGMVTSKEEINLADGVSVLTGNGTVTIKGAAGKSVLITNILGKTVASTVIASDFATISVPAGIVAISVAGEEAVKTVVR